MIVELSQQDPYQMTLLTTGNVVLFIVYMCLLILNVLGIGSSCLFSLFSLLMHSFIQSCLKKSSN
jgi:hypothetical protein